MQRSQSGVLIWLPVNRNGKQPGQADLYGHLLFWPEFDGQSQVIINGNPNVSSYDPVTGAELWSQPGVSGDVAPSPAVNSRFVYAVTDYAKLDCHEAG